MKSNNLKSRNYLPNLWKWRCIFYSSHQIHSSCM